MSETIEAPCIVEPDSKDLLTTEQAANRLSISERTLIRWTNAHKIKKIQLSEGTTRYDPKDVAALIKKSRV